MYIILCICLLTEHPDWSCPNRLVPWWEGHNRLSVCHFFLWLDGVLWSVINSWLPWLWPVTMWPSLSFSHYHLRAGSWNLHHTVGMMYCSLFSFPEFLYSRHTVWCSIKKKGAQWLSTKQTYSNIHIAKHPGQSKQIISRNKATKFFMILASQPWLC